jgi:hypothetical protein
VRLDIPHLVGSNEIGLVENDYICEGDLILCLRRVLQPRAKPFGIRNGDNRIKPCCLAYIGIDKKGLCHWGWIGKAGCLNEDRVKLASALEQAFDDADEIAAHSAADAAVVHFEHFLIGADDKVVVNPDVAEFIHDDSEFPAVILGENAVQQRCLTRTEIAGEHSDGNFFVHANPASLLLARPPPWPQCAGEAESQTYLGRSYEPSR